MPRTLPALAAAAILLGATAPTGQMRGTITTARKTPAVGAIVAVRPENSHTPLLLGTTGASGRFAFDGLADGTYRAEVRREGFSPVVKTGIAVKAPFRAVVELTLARGSDAPTSPAPAPSEGAGTLHLTVRTAPSSPLGEARIRLVRIGGTEDPRVATSDPQGGALFEGLAAGTWRLEILGAGLLPLRSTVEVAGETTIEATMAAQPADYRPAAQDLIVPEDVTPPPSD